jgi:putative addiction module component (TIGR02574 family)
MLNQTQTVFDSALALSDSDRALLVERLLETLSPEQEDVSEEDLFDELERRRLEVDQGVVKPIPWSEFNIEE